MAGWSLEDAKAAQRAAMEKPPCLAKSPVSMTTALVAMSSTPMTPATGTVSLPSPSPPSSVTVNGITYFINLPSHNGTSIHSAYTCDHAGNPLGISDLTDFTRYLTEYDVPKTSLDWGAFSHPVELVDCEAHAVTSVGSPALAKCLHDYPFLLDTRATCHISPEHSDFKTLRPIPPYPVKGLGGTSVYAIGLGTIELVVSSGNLIQLQNVLFVPASSVRLISVVTLNREGNYVSHFDSNSCWVTNQSGSILACSDIAPNCSLYTLISFVPRVAHFSSVASLPAPSSALYAACVSNLETWHCCLGHSNFHNIIDMAHSNAVKGMPIDLSTMPPKCDHCILGKQARTPVPKVREGPRATSQLGRVYINLSGPLSCLKLGNLYNIQIIDDFSGYVWAIPLQSKAAVAPALYA